MRITVLGELEANNISLANPLGVRRLQADAFRILPWVDERRNLGSMVSADGVGFDSEWAAPFVSGAD